MTPEQYEQFLEDLRRLRAALGLPDGALPVSPRDAFLECIAVAEPSPRTAVLEQAIVDACAAIGRQVVCDNACDDPYCILARALGRNPVPPPQPWRGVPGDYGDPRSNR